MARKSDVVFQKTFEGGWEKEIVRRSDGVSLDAYVTHPSSSKKLRSGNDLLKFVQENPKYLKYLDPEEVNFNKHPGEKNSKQVQQFIQAIKNLKSDNETNNSGKKSSKKSKTNNPDANVGRKDGKRSETEEERRIRKEKERKDRNKSEKEG